MADEIFNNDDQQNNQENNSQDNVYANEYTTNPYGFDNGAAVTDNYADTNYEQAPQQDDSAKTLSIVALILGIVSIVMGCCISFIGIITGIPGIICAAISLKKQKSGMAIAGLVCSIIGIVIAIISIILAVVLMANGTYQNILQSVQ